MAEIRPKTETESVSVVVVLPLYLQMIWRILFYYHFSGTTIATEVVQFYFHHCGTTAALPADDLADYETTRPI